MNFSSSFITMAILRYLDHRVQAPVATCRNGSLVFTQHLSSTELVKQYLDCIVAQITQCTRKYHSQTPFHLQKYLSLLHTWKESSMIFPFVGLQKIEGKDMAQACWLQWTLAMIAGDTCKQFFHNLILKKYFFSL